MVMYTSGFRTLKLFDKEVHQSTESLLWGGGGGGGVKTIVTGSRVNPKRDEDRANQYTWSTSKGLN